MLRQHKGEIGREFRIGRLQVDDLIALHHAQMQLIGCFEADDFHYVQHPLDEPGATYRTQRRGRLSRPR